MAQPPKIREPEFDPGKHDIRHVLDIGLQAKRETKGKRTRSGWTAGSLGYCLRRQFLERAGVEVPEDYPLRTFWIGDLIHDGYKNMMSNAGLLMGDEVHLVDEELELSGYVDMIWGGIVPVFLFDHEKDYSPAWQDFLLGYRTMLHEEFGTFPVTGDELKSANDYSARKMVSEGPSFHHLMQAASYGLILDRDPSQFEATVDRWRLSVIDKTDGLMNVFEVREAHTQRALERVEALNEYWKKRELPPCTCGVEVVWEKNYCKYATKRDANGKVLECCSGYLIDQATSDEFWDGVVVDTDAPEMGRLTEDGVE